VKNEGEEETKLWSGTITDHRSGSDTESSCREAEALLLELFLPCTTTCPEKALTTERPSSPYETLTKLNCGHWLFLLSS